MYPHHVFNLEPAGTFGMYPICYWQVSGRYFQPEPAMYSRCFRWFPGPLAPSVEREAMEAGLGGWFNGNLEDVPESWSGANSDASASQDRVGTTLLTTIGGRTLPNPVRVPNNMVHPTVLTSLMEGPIRPWQCLVWSEESPPRYLRDLPLDHTSQLGGVLLQIGPSLIDVDGEYRGGGVVEEVEENGGGDASIE